MQSHSSSPTAEHKEIWIEQAIEYLNTLLDNKKYSSYKTPQLQAEDEASQAFIQRTSIQSLINLYCFLCLSKILSDQPELPQLALKLITSLSNQDASTTHQKIISKCLCVLFAYQ